ncbi:hypothetical protein ACFL5P_04390, partial [candidate division KSB1 bacterium]
GERWKLPDTILAGIKYHHNLEGCPEEFQMEAIVSHTSNYIAKSAKIGESGNGNGLDLHNYVFQKSKITPDTIMTVKEKLLRKEEEIQNFLETII